MTSLDKLEVCIIKTLRNCNLWKVEKYCTCTASHSGLDKHITESVHYKSINVFFVKRALDLGPDQRESNENVLCLLIIIILISYIITYITIKLLIMENHPSQNWKQNSSSINIEAQNIDF